MTSFVRQFFQLMRPYSRQTILVIAFLAVYEAAKVLPPLLFKHVLDALTASAMDTSVFSTIVWLAAGIFVAEMGVAGIDFILDRRIIDVLMWAEKHLHSCVQEKLLSLSLGYHEREQTGEKIARLERGTERLTEMLGGLLWMLLPLTVQIIWTVVVLALVDWQIMVIFATAIPIFTLLTWRFHRSTYALRVEQEDLYEQSSGSLGESIINIKTVQAFAQETREHARYLGLRERIDTLGRRRMGYHTWANMWRSIVVNAARLAIILVAGVKAVNGELSVGSVVLLLTLSEKVYVSLFSLTQVMDRMVEAAEPLQRLFGLLETPLDVALHPRPVVPGFWRGEVRFEQVSFSYADNGKALDRMDLLIEPGQTVAFAGPSGGGKSTIVKMLLRFYDPTEGRVLVDGVDLKEIDLSAFRRQIGYVPQEVEVMSGTIWENLTYGRPDATKEEVERAAHLAHVDEFVSQFPLRYETLVGERGLKLSGGQRQRVGIARALLTDPSILVFDEATSALDAEAEAAIQTALADVAGKKTVIIIAHRLSTIRHADRIFVVERGRLVESGSHDRLLKQEGVYYRLVRLQTAARQVMTL